MGKNPFFGEDYEPEPPEPVNAFLYPERMEQRAKVIEEGEPEPMKAPRRPRGRPRIPR